MQPMRQHTTYGSRKPRLSAQMPTKGKDSVRATEKIEIVRPSQMVWVFGTCSSSCR